MPSIGAISMPGSIGVIGATGRLGSRVVRAAADAGVGVALHGSRAGWIGEVPDVVVDVATAGAFGEVVAYCRAHRVPLLSASSGLSAADRSALAELSGEVAVLRADNLSLGHHIQRGIIEQLRPTMRRLYTEQLATVGIVDRHPAYKKDRPSATALALRDRAVAGDLPVTIDSVRAGVPVCEHELRLALPDEEIVVGHAVRDWSAYAGMAVRAALWLAAQHPPAPSMPALYTMADFYSWLFATAGLNPAGPGTPDPAPGAAAELHLTRGA